MSAGSDNVRDCPRCGTPIRGETKFCPSCGYRLDEPDRSAPAPTASRPAGQGILGRIIPKRSQPAAQGSAPQIRTASEFAQPVANWPTKCPNCSFDLKAGVKYCPSCGFNVEVWLKRKVMPGKGGPSYYTNRKRFFSFEGYSLEGVTPAAVMYVIWGGWNLLIAVLAASGQIKVFYPLVTGEGFQTTPLTLAVLVAIGLCLLLSALGIMQVNSILYLLGIVALVVSLPLSILQIESAINVAMPSSPIGTGQYENLLAGLLGIMISLIGLIQSIRIRKYFFGGE